MARGNIILPSGTMVARRYRIEHLIGEGGMSAVYEVTHLTTGQRMALKTMRDSATASPDAIRRFLDESKMTAATKSEHIVKVTDADTDDELGIPFFVMELLEGENLQALLKEGPLRPHAAVALLRQASLALDRTHAVGLIHRDLKPENLFRTTRDDGSDCLKILDFGIAKVVDLGSYAETTRNVGTPLYMSPEQYDGDPNIDHRADLYSLGHIAFTLLVGHAYWEPEARQLGRLVRSVLQGTPEPARARARRWNVELPDAMDAWFARAAAKIAADRFDSAAELVDGLAAALGVGGSKVSALPRDPMRDRREKSAGPMMISSSPVGRPPARTRVAVTVAGGAIAVIGSVAVAFILLRPREDGARMRGGSSELSATTQPATAIAARTEATTVPPPVQTPERIVPPTLELPREAKSAAPSSPAVAPPKPRDSAEARRPDGKPPKKPAASNAAPSASTVFERNW
jgi:eukaryotic-like serine/threonine-protein kinase